MFKLTIRELLMLTVIVGLVVAWCVDRVMLVQRLDFYEQVTSLQRAMLKRERERLEEFLSSKNTGSHP